MSADPVLTAHQVADLIGCHYQTVRDYILSGKLKAAKRGGRWLIRQSWLDEFLAPIVSGPDEDEVEAALRAVDTGQDRNWRAVAAVLAHEVRRFRTQADAFLAPTESHVA